ncbi:FmdB family zinc ribbon protein [Salinibacterium soli]|uniref:Zinc ribbon domain-containing protein n=1 Tax=Antiquaquibacter soli TaxID=3064523 RepID=A0ABT9BRA8_9MICO|nr:FmdB family zinc ribbon protein [Protaetiibacter sp. WY-16]MDO7883484.1 zinc ribbon domain-containing protein [Protaetiibacter sp. WY-16]
MPTYSYRCTECSNAFDIHQSFTDDSLTVCPTCGGALRKVFSPVGVTFSGSGFYRTDSRAGSGGGSSAESSGSSSSSSAPAPAAAPAASSSASSSSSSSTAS